MTDRRNGEKAPRYQQQIVLTIEADEPLLFRDLTRIFKGEWVFDREKLCKGDLECEITKVEWRVP